MSDDLAGWLDWLRAHPELQTLLAARGHDIGEIDGMIGARSREAIKAEQARLGFEADGRAGRKILEALRGTSPDSGRQQPAIERR